ncbi:hypothetical protein SAMN02745673_01871 [Marinactinospora thermotolerans DSM 45154]|uniref:Uncharacterized protein n=1 Tax=Marinactinospora thermotolerans DSM 45154 TaxID=1122192 RepID=A0A1T4PLP1_9ACTN|nr:hypothetical protein SAMN02745673_01871 [Marinactinospora thermotolerans DSM 45154]
MSELPGLIAGLLSDEVIELEAWRLELSEGDQD